MDKYLAIITTVLVITQIIRVIQNTMSLIRERKLIKAQLKELEDVTQEDINMRRKADRLIVQYLEGKMEDQE